MDFTLSETQQDLAALTRQILTDQVSPQRLRAVEEAGAHLDRELWSALAGAGVLSAALPTDVGGSGLDLLEQCSVLIEIGRAVAPAPYLYSIAVAAAAIARFGTPAQRQTWARPAGAGEVVLTAALSEELGEASDAPVTRASVEEGGWQLRGTKAVVPAATVADAVLIPASTEDGPVVLVVPSSALRIEAQRLVDGDLAGALDLDGVQVPAEGLLGGAEVLDWILARATIGQCAQQLGVLERALELTASYAREREQFGRPIGSFQAVGQRLADAYIDLEACRLTLWEAAWRLSVGLPAAAEIATAKFWAADAGHRIAHTAVHVHGGTGIDVDAATHRYFVAAKRGEFALGAATAQLRRLGAELAATPA